MTILVLGGRGKTAGHLSELLNNANIPFLLGTSSTSHKSPYTLTHFDWLDETTYENPFLQASSASLKAISAVYLVAPPVDDMAPPMIKFIDLCRSKGVKRFVLLSASNINKGDHSMGQAHAYLDSCQDIEYVSLRPTWFMGVFIIVLRNTPGSLTILFRKSGGRSLSGLDQNRRQDLYCHTKWQSPFHFCF